MAQAAADVCRAPQGVQALLTLKLVYVSKQTQTGAQRPWSKVCRVQGSSVACTASAVLPANGQPHRGWGIFSYEKAAGMGAILSQASLADARPGYLNQQDGRGQGGEKSVLHALQAVASRWLLPKVQDSGLLV